MARVLALSASGYYAWRSRPASARATADANLTRRIRTIHAGSHGIYGAPRIHVELQAEGGPIARKRAAADTFGRDRRGQPALMRAGHKTRRAPDHRPTSDLVCLNFRRRAQQVVGRRHHVHSDAGGISLSRRRTRRLVAPDR